MEIGWNLGSVNCATSGIYPVKMSPIGWKKIFSNRTSKCDCARAGRNVNFFRLISHKLLHYFPSNFYCVMCSSSTISVWNLKTTELELWKICYRPGSQVRTSKKPVGQNFDSKFLEICRLQFAQTSTAYITRRVLPISARKSGGKKTSEKLLAIGVMMCHSVSVSQM